MPTWYFIDISNFSPSRSFLEPALPLQTFPSQEVELPLAQLFSMGSECGLWLLHLPHTYAIHCQVLLISPPKLISGLSIYHLSTVAMVSSLFTPGMGWIVSPQNIYLTITPRYTRIWPYLYLLVSCMFVSPLHSGLHVGSVCIFCVTKITFMPAK